LGFAKVEKNLVSLGFFTPSSKRIKDAKAKTISVSATLNGHRIEAKATIVPAALYGLPITADQDKYLALQKLITDLHRRAGGQVANPVSFSSAELLHVLKRADAGKNYRQIDEWLNVMASTTIISEGAVYLAGKKRWVKDRFHVFDRAVSFGKEIEPGVIADKNYVWLSEWQLENINSNHLIPVDLEIYRQLKNHIAKTLIPLLQIWLFASRKDGHFAKRYEELCQLLSIRQYHYRSRILEQVGPSLDELQRHGYLAAWSVEQTSDGKEYKIVLRHGEKFERDRQKRLGAQQAAQVAAPAQPGGMSDGDGPKAELPSRVEAEALPELTRRGIGESSARKLLARLPPDRPVQDLLEWGDAEIARQPGKIANPAGFYIRLLEEHSAPPPTFESSRQKKARLEAILAQQEQLQRAKALADAQESQKRQKGERRLAVLTSDQRRKLFERFSGELLAVNPLMGHYKPGSSIHDGAVRARLVHYLAEEPMDLLVLPEAEDRNRETGADGANWTD
jgi:hypothetical protein